MKKLILLIAIMSIGMMASAQDTTYTKLTNKQVLVEVVLDADTTYAVYTKTDVNEQIADINLNISFFLAELTELRFKRDRLIAIRNELLNY